MKKNYLCDFTSIEANVLYTNWT